jgi:preprotein translocase subunit SecF
MDIVGRRLWYFIVAVILAVVFIVALATLGIKSGVEFSSGSILNITFDQPVAESALVQELNNLGYSNALIQNDGKAVEAGKYLGYNIRINASNLDEATKTQVRNSLTTNLGTFKENEFDNISPLIAAETTRNASIAVVVAIIAMLLYIAFAFRKMPSPFKYGVCAVAGLVWDILVCLGLYAIFGKLFSWQIDLMFIAGILAVLGYSINNTVIVFDRMRENLGKGVSRDVAVVANHSVFETLGRSFNTSITTLIGLFVLALFVGASIQNFVIVLIIGTISGTITSTFLSPELVVAWEKKEWGSPSGRTSLETAKVKS